MKSFVIKPVGRVSGLIKLPGDKSISHRAAILSAVSGGSTVIRNFPNNRDCLFTIKALRKLGVRISFDLDASAGAGRVAVRSSGLFGLKKPKSPVFTGESGTTIRLLAGLLAGQKFVSRLTCASTLMCRPMRRICEPLRKMGAGIKARSKCVNDRVEEYPPLEISPSRLYGITYRMPIPSAQVKSAILLAGLYAHGRTCIVEPVASRDHTERMLKLFGARIKIMRGRINLSGQGPLVSPGSIDVPADISSAAFFIVLAALIPGSLVELQDVGLNPSRTGVLRVLKRMGSDITVQRTDSDNLSQEPAGDIFIRGGGLKGTVISEKEIPSLIDEIPILMVASSLACGRTVISSAQELRVKETDRIKSMSYNLSRMGARIRVRRRGIYEDIVIDGAACLRGAALKSFGDHRTAMSMLVAGAVAAGSTRLDDVSCINKSFPGFLKAFKSLVAKG